VTLFDSVPRRSQPVSTRPPSGHRRASIFGIVLAAASSAGLVLTFLPSNPLSTVDTYTVSPEVHQIANQITLTEEGRQIFEDSRPELLGSAAFRETCDGTPESVDDATVTVGCYLDRGLADGRIAIFLPSDERLKDQVVVTAGHEFLHAAYARLSESDRAALNPLLEQRWSVVPTDDPIQLSLTSSVGSTAGNRPTEQFAYLGTTVADLFAPELEAFYTRYFVDRHAVVAAYAADRALWQEIETGYTTAATSLFELDQANAIEAAQLQADVTQHDVDRASFDLAVESYNARSEQERSLLYVAKPDGSLGEPYQDYLTGLADSFEVREADLSARQSLIEANASQSDIARADVERLRLDLETLSAAATPTGG
jgi:hypothetical protein